MTKGVHHGSFLFNFFGHVELNFLSILYNISWSEMCIRCSGCFYFKISDSWFMTSSNVIDEGSSNIYIYIIFSRFRDLLGMFIWKNLSLTGTQFSSNLETLFLWGDQLWQQNPLFLLESLSHKIYFWYLHQMAFGNN